MTIRRFATLRPFVSCLLTGATFAGVVLLASLPGLGKNVRLVLAVAGFIAFVLVFRWALWCWRSDWSELWSPPCDRRTENERPSSPTPLRFRVAGRRALTLLLLAAAEATFRV